MGAGDDRPRRGAAAGRCGARRSRSGAFPRPAIADAVRRRAAARAFRPRAGAARLSAKRQHGPGLLLLDEPTSSLDMRHQIDLVETARRRAQNGTAVIAVLHDLNLAMRFADRIVLLHRGRLAVDGGRAEAITAETIRRIFRGRRHDRLYRRRACRSCCRRPMRPAGTADGITPQPLSHGVTGSSQNCQPHCNNRSARHRASSSYRRSAMRVSLLCFRRVRFSGQCRIRARRRRISRHAEGPRRAAGADLHRRARRCAGRSQDLGQIHHRQARRRHRQRDGQVLRARRPACRCRSRASRCRAIPASR